jgi:hypothetical protein
MIYTVGNSISYRKVYAERLKSGEPFQKVGRTANYPGGSVWQTREEAQKYATEDQEVFGVLADWIRDTAPNRRGNPWHDLLVDSDLVILNDGSGGIIE